MFVDPEDELRVPSGEPPDDPDPRRTGPASEPSEETDVTFLDDEEADVVVSNRSERGASDSSRPRR